jgi:RNA polymerase sigma factor (sigma-70 family)
MSSQVKAEGGLLEDRQKEFCELLDKSGASLYALLTRLTLREDIAEELIQELFIKLSNYNGLRKIRDWNAYAHKAAINLAFDWLRKQKRACISLDDVRETASKDNSPLSEMINAEELQKTLDAISRLNNVSRQVVVMRYIQQQPYEDIAEQVGKNPHQVRALCHKAISHLRDLLGIDRIVPSVVEEKEINNVEHR